MSWLADTGKGALIYLRHVLALVAPGHPVPTYRMPPAYDAPLSNWGPDDLKLLIEEGRRQYAEQVADLKEIRGRAQWLFTTGLALVATTAAVGADILPEARCYVLAIWVAGLVATSYAALGAAAIITVRADFWTIHTKPLSQYEPPIQPQLARDYAEILEPGDETVRTRVSVYRQAVVWLIVGGSLTLLAWLVGR